MSASAMQAAIMSSRSVLRKMYDCHEDGTEMAVQLIAAS